MMHTLLTEQTLSTHAVDNDLTIQAVLAQLADKL